MVNRTVMLNSEPYWLFLNHSVKYKKTNYDCYLFCADSLAVDLTHIIVSLHRLTYIHYNKYTEALIYKQQIVWFMNYMNKNIWLYDIFDIKLIKPIFSCDSVVLNWLNLYLGWFLNAPWLFVDSKLFYRLHWLFFRRVYVWILSPEHALDLLILPMEFHFSPVSWGAPEEELRPSENGRLQGIHIPNLGRGKKTLEIHNINMCLCLTHGASFTTTMCTKFSTCTIAYFY